LEQLLFIIALAAGSLAVLAWRWRQRRSRTEPAPAPPVVAEPISAEGDSLTTRLHRLEGIYSQGASDLAHPRELEDQSAFRDAVGLLQSPSLPLDTLMQYANGANWALACAALAALARRADGHTRLDEVQVQFDKLYPWPMYFALSYFAQLASRPPVGAAAVGAKDWWGENKVIPLLFRDYFALRERLGDTPSIGSVLHAEYASPVATIQGFLRRVNHPFSAALIRQLDSEQVARIDRSFLISFGRFWADADQADLLLEPAPWREALTAAEAASSNVPARPLLVSGDQRIGKTSFLRLLAKRLGETGWSVFEASGADLMAGQQWFGQLEGRIQRTIAELSVAKKLIWYIPDLMQMARSGTHQGQAASILDQLLPALAAGRLVVWTESTQSGAARLLQTRPTLRNIFELIRLEPQSPEETAALAQALIERLSRELCLGIDGDCVDVALYSARQHLNAANFPGPVLELIKATVARARKAGAKVVAASEVIVTLAQVTGLPISVLDSKERVDLAALRAYFARRVIGQDEAVAAIVDRIAMLKAGLNDPGKPIGVLLFAGSTGTGKTELAKSVAEYLFGSVDRLVRLDMSEYQTADAANRILGSGDDGDSLIGRVRKQPFSVVLLDEFEKAHGAIWDLFLQVFDDGRLTDAIGQVADFRHCMIILTTNLGAAGNRNSGFGFAPAGSASSSSQVLRAIGQTFRPEFQNRLDKVIVFQPLTRELMRQILKKELDRVLQRRGLKYREWAVEWEASAEDFLLEKGFSPDMGARPLKRAIDQYVIAPLAATIVEQRFPEGDQFVFVRSDGRAIQAEFVDPNSDNAPSAPPDTRAGAKLPDIILAPSGSPAEADVLQQEFAALERTLCSEHWEDLKAELAQAMLAPDFWSRPDRHETLARLALMDRIKAAMATAASLRSRLGKAIDGTGKHSRALAGRLGQQLYLIGQGIRDALEAAPIEVALEVEPAFEKGDAQTRRQWCLQLVAMYRAWADKRHMQLVEVAAPDTRRMPLLLISGFGAHRLLIEEVGLHVLEGEEEAGAGRVAARVRLAVAPLGDVPPEKLRAALIARIGMASPPHRVVRRYRSGRSPLVRNINGSWRSGRLAAVLGGDFDLIAASRSSRSPRPPEQTEEGISAGKGAP
jgi:ATP-dependent Clp protease ATP-binding subunit ClpC